MDKRSKPSFTIKCDNCGTERKIEDGEGKNKENSISLSVFLKPYGYEHGVDTIDIDCYNPECHSGIEINY